MIDALVILQLAEAVQIPLPVRRVHPVDVEVVVFWVPLQPLSDVGRSASVLLVEHELADDRREHISAGEKHVVLVFSHFLDYWISAH